MKHIFFSTLFFLFAASSLHAQQTDVSIDQRVETLLGKMTLEEKIGQMNQLSPWNGVDNDLSAIIRSGQVGSLLNLNTPEQVNAAQRIAVEESRLGIPLLMSRDVIHGYKTIFPIPLGQAASFNPQIAEDGARVAAIEASSDGIRWTFAPMIDVSRDARWGRIAESCGEDPYLTTVMGAAMIRGFQGCDLSAPTSIAACAKHFAGYGASEAGRDYNSTFIPERELRNAYLPPFERAAAMGCATFMTSFNDNDGIPSSGNTHLLRDILRGEWKYTGMVVSDWASVAEMVQHGFCADLKEAAATGVNAGVEMDMMGNAYITHLKDLVAEGKVSMNVIDNAVRDILRLKFRLGLFEQPYVVTPQAVKYCAEHLVKAKQAAIESAILLKNDGTLPINSKVKRILVVGPMADAPHDQMGTWVFDGEKDHTVTALAALREMYGKKVRIDYVKALAHTRDTSSTGIAKAVKAANEADLVLAFVGEEAIMSGEAHCLATIDLKGKQKQLIQALAHTGKPLVTIVMAGRPLTIGEETDLSNAVLYAFHPGTMGGPALAELLSGKAVPSGKTPVTFPKTTGQIPIYYNHHHTGRAPSRQELLMDQLPVEAGQTSQGCASYYLDAGFDPLFPFGYGLSYTTFEYGKVSLSADHVPLDGKIVATVTLTNTGQREGTEIVQLYVQDEVASAARPVRELKGFQRVTLRPQESRELTFELPVRDLAFYNAAQVRVVEPGKFRLWISPDSESGTPAVFTVE